VSQTWTTIQEQLSSSSRHHQATGQSLIPSPAIYVNMRSRSSPLSGQIQRPEIPRVAAPILSMSLSGKSARVNFSATSSTGLDRINPIRQQSHDTLLHLTSPLALPHPEHHPSQASSSEISSVTSLRQGYRSCPQRPYELRSNFGNVEEVQGLVDKAQDSVVILQHNLARWTDDPSTFTEYKTVSLRATLAEATMDGSPQAYAHAIIKLFQSLHKSETHSKMIRMLVAYTIWRNSSTLSLDRIRALETMMAYGRAAHKASGDGAHVAMIMLIPDTR
jgi:hypothetical protein